MKTDSNIQSKIIKFLPNDFFFFCRKLSLMGGVNFRVLDTLSEGLPVVTVLRAPPAWSSSMLRMLNIIHFRLPMGKSLTQNYKFLILDLDD